MSPPSPDSSSGRDSWPFVSVVVPFFGSIASLSLALQALEAALLSGGDAEWCQRLCAKGGEIRFEPAAEVRHPARRTLRGLIRQRRRTVGGRFDRARGVGHPPLPLSGVRSTYANPFGRLAHYRTHPLMRSPGYRLRFLLVELVLYAVTKLETARLRLGGRPLR